MGDRSDRPPVTDLEHGFFDAPVLVDEAEWASFTPCHLCPVRRAITDFHVLGEVTLRCPECSKLWAVRWDPWRSQDPGHALWID